MRGHQDAQRGTPSWHVPVVYKNIKSRLAAILWEHESVY